MGNGRFFHGGAGTGLSCLRRSASLSVFANSLSKAFWHLHTSFSSALVAFLEDSAFALILAAAPIIVELGMEEHFFETWG